MKQDTGATSANVTPAIKGSLIASRFFALIALALVIILLVLFSLRPTQHFYVRSSDGAKSEIFPLDEPNITPSSLIKWVTQAATSAYTIDFYHYKDNIDALKEYFTPAGYSAFLQALNSSGTLDRIINEKLVMSAVATDTAVVSIEGESNGTYVWQIQVPLLVSYQGASTNTTTQNIVVGMLVTRVPTEQSAKGIGIAQILDSEIHV